SRFSLGSQLSTIDFSVKEPGTDEYSTSRNWQLVETLGRPIRNHNLHVSYRDVNVLSESAKERQRSAEIEDVVQVKSLSFGGAIREQRVAGPELRNTLFLRA